MTVTTAICLGSRGSVPIGQVRLASRLHERFLGLMGRPRLGPGVAWWLTPCQSIHTCFMRFELDVFFLDTEGRVLKASRAVRPWRLVWAPRGTASVLEVESGWLPPEVLRIGDRLQAG